MVAAEIVCMLVLRFTLALGSTAGRARRYAAWIHGYGGLDGRRVFAWNGRRPIHSKAGGIDRSRAALKVNGDERVRGATPGKTKEDLI